MKRKPKHGQSQVGFRVGRTSPDYGGFGHATVEVIDLQWIDALQEVAGWAHNQEYAQRWTERACFLKRHSDGTFYLKADREQAFELQWQDDNESRNRWYAGKVYRCYFESIEFLSRVMKGLPTRCDRLSPQEVVAYLIEKHRAIPVTYCSDPPMDFLSAYLPSSDFKLEDTLPPPILHWSPDRDGPVCGTAVRFVMLADSKESVNCPTCKAWIEEAGKAVA